MGIPSRATHSHIAMCVRFGSGRFWEVSASLQFYQELKGNKFYQQVVFPFVEQICFIYISWPRLNLAAFFSHSDGKKVFLLNFNLHKIMYEARKISSLRPFCSRCGFVFYLFNGGECSDRPAF